MIYQSSFPDTTVPSHSLGTFTFQHSERFLNKPAIIDGPSGRSLTYGQLMAMIQRMAAGLQAKGFGKGDVFAIFCPNIPKYAVALFGIAQVGGIATTVNPLYTTRQ